MELHLKITGYICIGLALVHIIFPRYFRWTQDLKPVTLINRQLLYVHTFFIALIVLLMGILCISSASALIHTALGEKIILGLFIFWSARWLFQFFVYSPELWKGKALETTAHIIFSLIWTYFVYVFGWIYFN